MSVIAFRLLPTVRMRWGYVAIEGGLTAPDERDRPLTLSEPPSTGGS